MLSEILKFKIVHKIIRFFLSSRFQVLEKLTRDYPRSVQVRILKDVTLQSPEKRLLLEGQRPRGLMAACSSWPGFVYRPFEGRVLVDRVTEAMAPIVRNVRPSFQHFPDCFANVHWPYLATMRISSSGNSLVFFVSDSTMYRCSEILILGHSQSSGKWKRTAASSRCRFHPGTTTVSFGLPSP